MSSNSFNLLGLLRSDQVYLEALIGFLALILVSYFIITKHSKLAPEDMHFTRRIARLVALVGIIVYLWHFIGILFSNRVPREDIDRTTIYQQMNDNRHSQP